MVYGRQIGEHTLELEASGALQSASLVMRDRQTDSWWSLMDSSAIGGQLLGVELEELPVGRKTTWAEWRRVHPDTLVLSVDGLEHVAANPYDRYFASDDTFRELRVADLRLPPKEPVFAFWTRSEAGRQAWAVAHERIEGGRVLDVGSEGERLLVLRERGAEIYASTEAWWIHPADIHSASVRELVGRVRAGEIQTRSVEGFDTFWYTWVGVHPESRLVR